MAVDDEDLVSPSSSPKKVKFLCSHGGRILPRPSDGHLKYVGGETRVVSVPRHITFSELKKRLSEMSDGETILKYQISPEDLDVLVTVKNDDDLLHMFHEYDRITLPDHPTKLRTFLFPSIPSSSAAGGIGDRCWRPKAILTARTAATSAGSSPNSDSPVERLETGPISPTNMHRVQSSPSLYRPSSHHCRQFPPAIGRQLSAGRSPFAHFVDHYYTSQSAGKYRGGYCCSNNGNNHGDDQLLRSIDRAETTLPRSPRKRLWD